MTPEQYERVVSLYQEWQQLDTESAPAFLERLRERAPNDANELSALIAADSDRPDFLDTGVIASRVLQARLATERDHSYPGRPRRIGPYTLHERIGSGGMGVVYRAEQEKPKREVAVKLLRSDFTRNDLESRFAREAEILGRLQHPGIAQVFEAGTEIIDGTPTAFIAMELVRGVTLDQFSHDGNSLGAKAGQPSLSARIDLLIQIAEAVHHAHVRGVIHRDLKPGNILVDERGRTKILDFGIARIVGSEPAGTLQTREGEWIGTVAYMSPEQIEGRIADLDTRSDVYALSLIAYELLSSQMPFASEGVSFAELIALRTQQVPAPLSAFGDVFRGDLETIVGKGLEVNKEARYASAAEFAMDLRRYLQNEPIQARPPTTIYRLRKFARRHRGWVVGFSLAAASLVIGAMVSIFFAISAKREADRAERRFVQVYDLSKSFLFEFEAAIRHLPGSTPARELLVSKALGLLVSLTADAETDPDLASDLAWAYFQVGNIQELQLASTSQQLQMASASYRQSESIYARLNETHRDSIESRLRWARAKEALARIQMQSGNTEEAVQLLQEALALLEAVVESDPNAEHRTALAEAMSRKGLQLLATGEAKGSSEWLEKSHEILRAVYRETDKPVAGGNVAIALDRLGNFDKRTGNATVALARYEEAAQIRRALAADDPQNAALLEAVTVSHNKIGDHYRATGRFEEAESEYRAGLEIRQRLLAADPFNSEAQRRVSVSWERIGDLQVKTRDTASARASFEVSLEISERLAKADPSNLKAQRNLAIALTRLGDLESRNQNHDASRTHYLAAQEIRKRLVELEPKSAKALRQLAIGHNRLGRLESAAGESEHALAEYREALAIARRITTMEPDHLRAQLDAAIFSDHVSKILLDAGRLDEAERTILDNLALKTKMIEDKPGDRAIERGRLTSLFFLGELYTQRMEADPTSEARYLELAIGSLEDCLAGFAARHNQQAPSPQEEAQIVPIKKKLNELRATRAKR